MFKGSSYNILAEHFNRRPPANRMKISQIRVIMGYIINGLYLMSSGEQGDYNMVCPTDIIPALMAVLNLMLLMQKTRGFCKLFRIP